MAQGIQYLPIRYPRDAPAWFTGFMDAFIKDVLTNVDVRNALEGPGVSITGQPDQPATISSSEDLQQLLDENFILAEPSAFLANARVLAGETGVVVIDDDGPGADVEISLAPFGISDGKLRQGVACSVIGNGTNAEAPVSDLAADINDTLLARVGDVLDFFQLTLAMAPDALWTNAKLADMADSTIKGRAAGAGTGAPQDLSAAQVKAILALVFADIGGTIADGQVPQSAVTQHQAALAIAFSQLTGTIANAQVPAGAVTQHQAALSIAFSQLTSTPQIPGGLSDFADDAAAALGGIAVNGLYRTASAVKIRVT